MAQQYKRSICYMCVTKDRCDGLRWGTYCGTCADSLKCAAQKGIANAECKKLRAAWLDLPRNCLLVSHLVNQKSREGVDNFHQQDEGTSIVGVKGAEFICPRCSQNTASIYVDHSLNHRFKRQTKYILTCDYCAVDETVSVP